MDGGIISAMKALTLGKFRFLALLWTAVALAVVAWALLAGGPAEPAAPEEPGGIRVNSPSGVATLEGELRRP